MKTSPKDKRTKDQLLQLLDDALVQEERRAEEINALRTEVEELRKRAEDPRAELLEDAIPSSKVPFRIDFYQTTNGGPLKGIIEHLPSRQKRTFAGDGQAMIAEFVAQFLPLEKMPPTSAQVTIAVSAARVPPVEIAANDAAGKNGKLLDRLHEEFLLQFPELKDQATENKTGPAC